MFLLFLSSGLFLGWSLGANDAANIFGTAVGTRMVRFKTAAILCGIGVILGAAIAGSGTTDTITKLGSVQMPAAAFTICLAAGLTVFWLTKIALPVSTSQAIIGAIVGFNLFAHAATDFSILLRIVVTWVAGPILAGAVAYILYRFTSLCRPRIRLHMLKEDALVRSGLLIVGLFGAFSLGSNNIANVTGVFMNSTPLHDMELFPWLTIPRERLLFLIGGLSIAVGVVTYSKRVMNTLGRDLFRLSPITAVIVVFAHSIVLFLFSSVAFKSFLTDHGLPSLPLVPLSSSQAVVGAILGIGLAKNLWGIRIRIIGEIAAGWVATPLVAGILCFFLLFFIRNVFELPVTSPITPVEVNERISSASRYSVDLCINFPRKIDSGASHKLACGLGSAPDALGAGLSGEDG